MNTNAAVHGKVYDCHLPVFKCIIVCIKCVMNFYAVYIILNYYIYLSQAGSKNQALSPGKGGNGKDESVP